MSLSLRKKTLFMERAAALPYCRTAGDVSRKRATRRRPFPITENLANYFFALANRLFTSSQLITFHHAAR